MTEESNFTCTGHTVISDGSRIYRQMVGESTMKKSFSRPLPLPPGNVYTCTYRENQQLTVHPAM